MMRHPVSTQTFTSQISFPCLQPSLRHDATPGVHADFYQPDFFSLSATFFACISCFFCLALLPAFSCCLVFLGALPAASASFFFWLLDLGGIVGFPWFCRRGKRKDIARSSNSEF